MSRRLRDVSSHSRRRTVQTMRRAHHVDLAAGAGPDAHDLEVDLLEGGRPLADLDDLGAGRDERPDQAGRRSPPGRRRPRRCSRHRSRLDRRRRPGTAARRPTSASSARRRPSVTSTPRTPWRPAQPAGESTRSRPPRTNATRSHSRSASSRLWVARTIVRPARRSSSIASRTTNAASGSSAAVGSSRKTTAGSWSSARAIASFCFMPLLNVPAMSSRRSHSENRRR